MHDLRLVGVHEDGQTLLLCDDDGDQYQLPLDEALRAAARRDRPRLGQLQIEMDGGLRPRDVQALIRAGMSTQEVAERAGWTVEKVQRYEGPVLAEREYVASLAKAVPLRRTGRSGSPTLANRVAERLNDRGVEARSAVWDASRDDAGQWTVSVLFAAGGRQRTAHWTFDVGTKAVHAHDDEARWLSEEDTDTSGPIPAPHHPAAAENTTVYDLESDGGVNGPLPRRRPSHEPVDLMAAMRESSRVRGRRRRGHQPTLTPVDLAPREDALPLEPPGFDPEQAAPPPPARGTHPLDEPAADDTPPTVTERAAEADAAPLAEAVGDGTRAAGPSRRRAARPSVPRWDDIMFGTGRAHPDDR